MKKDRSRILILNYIMTFCLQRYYSDDYRPKVDSKYALNYPENQLEIGSLVVLESAPFSNYYLGWLRDVKPSTGMGATYLIESVETGELCNWSNVGIKYFKKELTDEHPEWQWDDDQHDFNDRWSRVCFKKCDAYIILPMRAEFTGDKSVKLKCRERFWGLGGDTMIAEREFPNYKKLRVKDMIEAYESMSTEMEEFFKERKNKAQSSESAKNEQS